MKKMVKNIMFEASRLKNMSNNIDINVRMSRTGKKMLEGLKSTLIDKSGNKKGAPGETESSPAVSC